MTIKEHLIKSGFTFTADHLKYVGLGISRIANENNWQRFKVSEVDENTNMKWNVLDYGPEYDKVIGAFIVDYFSERDDIFEGIF